MAGNRIVVVCTANKIRSPFVAGLLRSRLPAFGGHHPIVESAGTAARPGDEAAPEVIELARAHGLDLAGHRTRRLGDGVLTTGDTVLCAERAHRRVVLDVRPDLITSVFTVREFARLVHQAAPRDAMADWSALVSAASRARLAARMPPDETDDLVDPVGRPPEVWTEFERQATEAVSIILRAVAALPAGRATDEVAPRVAATRRDHRARLAVPSTRRAMRRG